MIGALRSLLHPTILFVVLVPLGLGVAIGIGAGWWYGDAWTAWVQAIALEYAQAWMPGWDVTSLARWLAIAVVVALWLPAVLLVSTLIAAVVAMPLLVRQVARARFPGLERRHGGTLFGSAWNAVAAIGCFLALWVLTLPLWLLGPAALLLPLLLSAYLNQRLFRYDALSEHADAVELREVIDASRGPLFLLGLITGVLYFVPPLNLVAPVYSALAFIHYCLAELERRRAGESPGAVPLAPA